MTHVQTFTRDAFHLRVVRISGQPWFHTKDVCASLNLSGPPSDHLTKVDSCERRVLNLGAPIDGGTADADFLPPGTPSVSIVTDRGLRKMVRCVQHNGRIAFNRWLTDEVFPALGVSLQDQAAAKLAEVQAIQATLAEVVPQSQPLSMIGLRQTLAAMTQERAKELAALAPRVAVLRSELNGLETMQAQLRKELAALGQAAAALEGGTVAPTGLHVVSGGLPAVIPEHPAPAQTAPQDAPATVTAKPEQDDAPPWDDAA
jgi:prophage antirepressor-like protein